MPAFIQLLDTRVLVWLFVHRVAWLTHVMLVATSLAATFEVILISLAVVILLRLRRHHAALAGFLCMVTGSNIALFLIKRGVERMRPPLFVQAYEETGYSFPSGHTMNAVVIYGFLAYMAWHMAPQKWHTPLAVLCALIAFAVGCSRLYLGVHYLSDVVGGVALGGVFLLIGIGIARRDLRKKSRSR